MAKEKNYQVDIERETLQLLTVYVTATSKEEARQKALEEARRNDLSLEWEDVGWGDYTAGDPEIEEE